MKYYITTTDLTGKALLGTDYSRIVHNAKSMRKIKNAVKLLQDSLFALHSIKPFLKEGYKIVVSNEHDTKITAYTCNASNGYLPIQPNV